MPNVTPNLTELGTLEYNGYRFNETTRTKSVQVTPVYDSSGRTCIANQWKCTFQTYVAASSTHSLVQDAVTRLTHPGGALVFQARGLGNPDINTGQVHDLMWGPKPGTVQLDVIGAGNAVKLTWSVEFAVPCCPDGKYQFALMEFAYTVEHDVDDAGFITRRVRGHLQIPMTRNTVDDRTLSDSADLYRQAVPLPLMLGFKRTWQPWLLSEDRRRLDFGYTDEEQGGEPLPEGIVEATISESTNATGAKLLNWSHTIEGNYRVHRTANGNVAFNAFMNVVVANRIKDLKKSIKASQSFIPTSFSASNPNRHGKPAARFSISFTYISSLEEVWKSAKLFDPIPGVNNTWQKWQTSLLNTALNPYGAADLVFATQDRIVDLCEVPGNAGNNQLVGAKERGLVDAALIARSLQAAFPKPTSDKSWLHYENNIYLESDDGTIPLTTLPTVSVTSDSDLYGSVPSFAGGVDDAFDKSPFLPTAPGANPTQITNLLDSTVGGTLRRTSPTCYLTMKGCALRVAYAIDPPRLILVNGVKCIPANRVDRGEGFTRGVSANCLYPIHWCSWKLRYYLPSVPQGPLPSPPNPLLGAT